jgi:transposase
MAMKKRAHKVLSKVQRVTREKAIIRDLHAGGMSYRQIAAKHHVSLPTVNAKARKAGITRRRGRISRAIVGKATPRITAKARLRTAKRTIARRVKARTIHRTWTGGRGAARFNENFRKLVMSYYPSMPLAKFERLTRMIRQAVTL